MIHRASSLAKSATTSAMSWGCPNRPNTANWPSRCMSRSALPGERIVAQGPGIVDQDFKPAETLERCVEEPVDLVEPSHSGRGSKSLPFLQVFHDGLLFLTFLPGSARRSATGDHGSDPRLGHRSCDFLESSGATWLNVGDSGSTAGNSRNPWFFLETQLAASGGWVFHDRLESKESFRSSDRRSRFQPHKPS